MFFSQAGRECSEVNARTGRTRRRRRALRAAALAAFVMVAGMVGACGARGAAAAAAWELDFLDPFGFADARLMGMGYSHVAVWDAPNPLYSNPASFGLGEQRLALSLGSGWGDSEDADSFKFIALSDEDRDGGAGGFAWGQYRWSEEDEQFSGNTFNYVVGKSFADWGALGIGLRYLRGGGVGDPEEVPSWRGLAADAGLVLKHEVIAVGVVARDVTVTRLAFADGTSATISPSYSCGLSLRLGSRAVLAVDAHGISGSGSGGGEDDQEVFSGGFEGWLLPYLALRGGIIVGDGQDREARSYTGGIGLRFGDFEMSYALVTASDEVRRQCVTLTRRF